MHVKQKFDQPFLHHIRENSSDSADAERGGYFFRLHFFPNEPGGGQRGPATAQLQGKSILETPGMFNDPRRVFRNQQFFGVGADPQRSRADARRIADGIDLYDKIHLGLRNTDLMQRSPNQIVGDRHDLVGASSVNHGIAERTAGRRAVDSVDIAVTVAGWRSDKGHVDLQFAAFDGPGSAAMGTNHDRVGQPAGGNELAKLSAQTAGIQRNNDARLQMRQQCVLHFAERTGGKPETANPLAGDGVDHQFHNRIAITQMMMEGNRHAILQATSFDSGLNGFLKFFRSRNIDAFSALLTRRKTLPRTLERF